MRGIEKMEYIVIWPQAYLDKLNNTCVLFTDITWSDHNDNDKTKLDKEDYIVVETIYHQSTFFMVLN
jgi:hypothetical protein